MLRIFEMTGSVWQMERSFCMARARTQRSCKHHEGGEYGKERVGIQNVTDVRMKDANGFHVDITQGDKHFLWFHHLVLQLR